jgi:hypothetical protein
LADATLDALHNSCPGLKALHITFPRNWHQYSPNWRLPERATYATYGKPDVAVFSDLTELTLNELYDDLPWWKSQITRVLNNSPRLSRLQLSISRRTLYRYHADGESEAFDRFFDQLCDNHGESGAPPLHLRSLHLGTAVYPTRLPSLQKLTDLRFLEEVHITNGRVWHGSLNIIDPGYTTYLGGGLAYDAFGPAHCPRLRSFRLTEYDECVHRFLATVVGDAAVVRKLAIACRDTMASDYRYEMAAALLRPDPAYPSLPLCPRMLNVDLQLDWLRLARENRDDFPGGGILSAKAVLEALVSADDGGAGGPCRSYEAGFTRRGSTRDPEERSRRSSCRCCSPTWQP